MFATILMFIAAVVLVIPVALVVLMFAYLLVAVLWHEAIKLRDDSMRLMRWAGGKLLRKAR